MKFDAVIFDIDNVLVDTRASYADCIRKTVETYLETVLGFQPSRQSLLTRRDVEEFKTLGGFNDDWDTCYGLLLYFLSLKIKRKTINELRKSTPPLSSPHRWGRTKVGGKNIFPLGVKGMWRLFGKSAGVGLKPALTIKKITEIFQRFYLGELVWNEKLLISKAALAQLKRSGLKLGILTGRSREEAGFALRRFQIDSLMETIVTADDTPKGLKKPNPYGLLKIARTLGKHLRYLYVGDLPDDVLAARRAKREINISSCGFLLASVNPEVMKRELKGAKADYVCRTPKELINIILPTSR